MTDKMNGDTLTSRSELMIVAPRSSAFAEIEPRSEKDMRKVYSMPPPPPDIDPWDGTDVGMRVCQDDPAEELNRLTLSDNVTERERAKNWMRTAVKENRDAVYWKAQAADAFARSERLLGRAKLGRALYMVSFFGLGASMYDLRWIVMAGILFVLALLWEQKIHGEKA